jgi:hypothetical protein
MIRSNSINKLEIKIRMPLKRVDPEEEKPEEEEITIYYDIRHEPEEKQSSIAGYSYYTIVN